MSRMSRKEELSKKASEHDSLMFISFVRAFCCDGWHRHPGEVIGVFVRGCTAGDHMSRPCC